jgi:hypothetical protein
MPAMKYLLMMVGTLLFGSAAGLVGYDIFVSMQLRRLLPRGRRRRALVHATSTR